LGTQNASSYHAHVHELAIVLVLKDSAGGRVVGHIDIGPAVIIEIRGQYAESIKPGSLLDPGTLGHIRERTITVVVIQNVGVRSQTRRPAGAHDALVEARSRFWDRGSSQIATAVAG